jgi:hypothetical protein
VAQVNVLTPKQVAQQQQAQSVAVEDLPEAKVIEVQAEQASPTQEAPIEVSEEQPTEAMQALMNEPEAAPEAAPEVAPEVALEVTSAANIQSPVAAVPEVTVEVEPAETQVDNRLALLGILLLVLVVSMIWARIKGPVQNKSKVKPVPNKPA